MSSSAPTPRRYGATAPRSRPPVWQPPPDPEAGRVYPTGARRTRAAVLAASPPKHLAGQAPSQFAVVPGRLDYWGNDQYGICVSAEEAFAKACYVAEIFLPAALVIAWASQRGFRDGAFLDEVLDAMAKEGFRVDPQLYNDGPKSRVEFRTESQLHLAIAAGPVKIAIDSSALPSAAGNRQGWFARGGIPGQFANTDHCVSLSGYGPAAYLYSQLGVPLPVELSPSEQGYLLFTWSTIGFVDHAWLLSTCTEAWLRSPTTVGVPPLPEPTPPGPPPPPPDPWWDYFLPIVISLLKTLGPAAVPILERMIESLGLPGWLVHLIEELIEQLLAPEHPQFRGFRFRSR